MLFQLPLFQEFKKPCVLDSWLGGGYASIFFFFIVLVERIFCCSSFKLTLRVGRERGRILEIIFDVRPGHVIKSPLFIA